MSRVYLDHNATTPLRVEARAAMLAAMDVVGNPSSVHAEGREAKMLVEHARAQVAALVGCEPTQVVFTGSATEAAALAIPQFATVASAGIEHDAVMAWVQADGGGRAQLLDVDGQGVLTGTIGGKSFENGIWDDVVTVQAANSETGVIQDTAMHAQALHALGRQVLVLVDAVQAIGKLPFSMQASGADMVLASGHKLGGPKGVGALILRSGLDVTAKLRGGGQELGRRSGTENVIGIAGFGAAAEAAQRDVKAGKWDGVEKLRNILESALEAFSNTTIFIGKGVSRIPNTSCFATPGWKGETQVMQMDLAGFAISAGSACSSGKVKASRVLSAMGLGDVAANAVRVSLGLETTEDDILRFADVWAQKLRKHEARAA
jgi:cysteine desulfurase